MEKDFLIIEKARKQTLIQCLKPLDLDFFEDKKGFISSSVPQVIASGQGKNKTLWAADIFVSGPAAFHYLKEGASLWRNSLLAIGKRQYSNGKIPACISLNMEYQPASPYFDTYGMWWILSANDYLEKTNDTEFESIFLPILRKAFDYYLAKTEKDLLITSSFPNFYWNWSILRPRKSALINALFYEVLKVAGKFGLEGDIREEDFKECFNEYFWHRREGAFAENLFPKTLFLDSNSLSIIFDLAREEFLEEIIEKLDSLEGNFGPLSHKGDFFGINDRHKEIVSPFSAYLYVLALKKVGLEEKAEFVFKKTISSGLGIAREYGKKTIPEFWGNNGRIGPGVSLDREGTLPVNLCHGWGSFGDLNFKERN